MPADSARNADSFGVVIVLGLLGGCWALVIGALDAGFADDVGHAAGRAWPSVLTAFVLWTIAAAGELAAYLHETRRTLPLTGVIGRAMAVAVVGLGSLGIALGLVELLGMSAGLLGLVTVLAGWVSVSAGPIRMLLRPSAARPRP